MAQKTCSTLFLDTLMATLHEFITQAAVMARQDREVRCLPHEFCSCKSNSDRSSANNLITMSIPLCFLFVLPGGV